MRLRVRRQTFQQRINLFVMKFFVPRIPHEPFRAVHGVVKAALVGEGEIVIGGERLIQPFLREE